MDLQQLLINYTPFDDTESLSKAKMLEFINSCNNPFSREQTAGHFTGSAFLLNSTQDKFLLMHHAKLDIWLQPGGHCDGDHNVLNVSIKEAQEESGIMAIEPVSNTIYDLDVHLVPANSKHPAHYHYDVRFLLKSLHDELVPNEESKELRWINQDLSNSGDIELHESIIRMINKFF